MTILVAWDSMTKVYATDQKADHEDYKSIYNANAEEFAMMERQSQYVHHPVHISGSTPHGKTS